MNNNTLRVANLVIRDLGNQTEYLGQYNIDDRACESLERFCEAYGLAPSSKVNELSSFISQNNMIYLGNVREPNGGIVETYISNTTESAKFYRIQLQKDTLISGDIAFEETHPMYDMPDDNVFESAFLSDDFDFFDYAMEADAPPANNNEEANNDVEDITKTTADAMGDDGGDDIPMFGGDQNNDDPSSGGVDPNTDSSAPGDGGDVDDSMGDSDGNDDQQPPDMMDETDDGDNDDEGTVNKRRIRANMVKLHNVIQDSLNAMDTFTPDYGFEISKHYYKMREQLSTIDGLLLNIVNETINDLTVEALMKKYRILNNIYDIIIRKMKEFKRLYKKEIEAKH